MGGIAGLYHLETAKPVDPARVRMMLAPMQHRGPDGSGTWTAPGVGLGHLQLAIIDMEGSPQPMLSDDENAAISFDGEIYNHRELRQSLRDMGHRIRTESDAEVILAAWRQWGPHCLQYLHGTFALAIHDHMAGQLFLARDRLGVKPLHYALLSDGSIAFASELKGLLAHPMLRIEPDISAVEDYFAFGYVPDDSCFVGGVQKLAAGYFLSLKRGQPLGNARQYWDVDFSKRVKASAAECEEHLVALMKQAVTSRMSADVPLGALLSGGVDSSAIVALMAEASPRAVKTSTIGFREAEIDESEYAERIAQRFATDHRSRILPANDTSLIDRIAQHFDEPFADPSALPMFRLCELARENVGVTLSGDGADEAFAGDGRLLVHRREERIRRFIPQGVRRNLLGPMGKIYPLRGRATLSSLSRSGAQSYAEAVGGTPLAMRRRLFTDAARRALDGHVAEERYGMLMEDAPARDPLDRAQYADLKTGLPGQVLTRLDRMSMAVSLEARAPLLDHRLVEFAATLPVDMRVRRGTGKWLMRKAMERYLPDDIAYRPNHQFALPVSEWLREGLSDTVRPLAGAPALGRTGWLDMKQVDKIVTQHLSGKADHGRLIWQILMLDKAVARIFKL